MTSKKFTKKFIDNLNSNYKDTISELTVPDLKRLVDRLNIEYHENSNNIVSDDVFDEIKDYALSRGAATVDYVGSKVGKKETVKLPYWMGSMKKFKPEHEKDLKNWMKKYKGPFVISDKLDGVSGLYDGSKLYTRGDGSNGRDISHLISKVKGFPKNVPEDYVVRGEIIITKCDFNILVDNDVVPDTGNPRNTVAGITNAKKPNAGILDYVKFVAYELVQPRMPADEQMRAMSSIGFITANNITSVDVSINNLTHILQSRKKESPFEIDGIIITDSSKDHGVNKSGNPEHAFAFKLPTSEATVLVTDVVWQISKDRLAKPTVVFESVSLGGVTIKKATGFNARFIIDNGIGPGAEIVITRSGDVIPYIKRVVSPVHEPLLPTTYKYEFTKNGVDIVVVNDENNTEVTQQIDMKHFQNTVERLEIEGLKKSSIEKLFNAGVRSLKSLFELDDASLTALKLPAFGDKKVRSVIEAVNKVKTELDCMKLMVASNAFGRGSSKTILSLILAEYPQIINSTKNTPTIEELIKIDGIGLERATNFVENIDSFKKYITDNDLGKYCTGDGGSATKEDKKKSIGKILSGMKILFSGGKDKELMQFITDNGGELVSSISKSTDILIMKDPNEQTSKQTKAIKLGIKIMTPSEFMKKYKTV